MSLGMHVLLASAFLTPVSSYASFLRQSHEAGHDGPAAPVGKMGVSLLLELDRALLVTLVPVGRCSWHTVTA